MRLMDNSENRQISVHYHTVLWWLLATVVAIFVIIENFSKMKTSFLTSLVQQYNSSEVNCMSFNQEIPPPHGFAVTKVLTRTYREPYVICVQFNHVDRLS